MTTETHMIPTEDINIGCPACGHSLPNCEGHSLRDREANAILDAHDDGDHTGCHPDGCRLAGQVTKRGNPAIGWTPPTSAETAAPVPSGPTTEADADLPSWARRVTQEAFRGEVSTSIFPDVPVEESAEEEPVEVDGEAPDPAELVWEEPTETKRHTWADTAEVLKTNPGKWAKVVSTPERPHANRARNALRYHGIATKVKTEKGIVTVWACYEEKEDS